MRVFLTFFLLSICLFRQAHAGFEIYSYDQFADMMLNKFPFRDGVVTREAYEAVGQKYLENTVRYYQGVSEKNIDRARAHNRTDVETRLKSLLAMQVEEAHRYVAETEVGIFQTFDPDQTGLIYRAKARALILVLAQQADFNHNGLLEPPESDLAEAAIVRGVDIGDPVARDHLVRELDRNAFQPY